MANYKLDERELATRPDRIDFRDREYAPRLISLPESFPAKAEIKGFLQLYRDGKRILDQGTEGACTGYGLAAVINYITWDRWIRANDGLPPPGGEPPPLVSPLMLYDIARAYDEWEGEAYSGSSCRGAMKGWHKHGACRLGAWPRDDNHGTGDIDPWQQDALARPLGAYYRVNARSISDMQAAVHEVRAVYCSARIHEGWSEGTAFQTVRIADLDLPVIELIDGVSGGHAFAIVGYTQDGFIIQNS